MPFSQLEEPFTADDGKIMRYLNLPKLVLLACTESLFFTRVDDPNLNDQLEAIHPKEIIEAWDRWWTEIKRPQHEASYPTLGWPPEFLRREIEALAQITGEKIGELFRADTMVS